MKEQIWRGRFAKWSKFSLLIVLCCAGGLFILLPLQNFTLLRFYYLLLLLWFLLLLSSFHYIYFNSQRIRQVHVRMIDYPYIGFGVVGFFLLTSGQHERDPYWNKFSQLIADAHYDLVRPFISLASPITAKHREPIFARVPSTIDELKSYVADLRAYRCEEAEEEYKALSKEFCVFVSDVANFLDSANSQQLWATVLENLRKFAYDKWVTGSKAPGGLSFVSASLKGSVFSREYQRAYWYKYEISLETTAILNSLEQLDPKPSRSERLNAEDRLSPTVDRGWIGALKYVLWPFILAVSLALRLTKVTADVTGWARST